MDEQVWIETLEKSNGAYLALLESGDVRLAQGLKRLKQAFPFHMYAWLQIRHRYLKSRRLSQAISHPISPENRFYYTGAPVREKKGVVYTCVTGGYDVPLEPLLRDEWLQYTLYSDETSTCAGNSVWQTRSIAAELVGEKDGNRVNRYYKFHPFAYFPDHDYALYIDGNVQIISDVTVLCRCAEQAKLGIAMHHHAQRDCLYEEAQWCLINHRGNPENIQAQIDAYRQEGMPESFGLWEATIIATDLKNPLARQALTLWWEEYCRWGSGRDQIAFPYVLWKNGWQPEDVGCLGNDEYHNPKFRINSHRITPY